jgi:cytidylate kinase
MIIAIDGPAGAGKSTVARIIAQRLGFLYIDTGAMYRALTLKIIQEGIKVSDIGRIIQAAQQAHIELKVDAGGSLRVCLDSVDITNRIRQPEVTAFVSDIAKIGPVRQIMLKTQRKMGQQQDAVLDGRDIGTVVFPQADKKFYLDASVQERAKRRYQELKEAGQAVTLELVALDIARRDKIDSTREFAPLKKASDAVYLDTTEMTIKEVVQKVLDCIR